MFLWTIPDDYPERLIGTYDPASSTDRLAFKQGLVVPAEAAAPIVRFPCSAKALVGIDDLASNAMVPIVSERLQDVLQEKCPGDVQLLRVRVVARDGDVSGYRIVNVVTKVNAIDHGASVYTCIPGTQAIMRFRRLVLRPDALGQRALARDAECLSNLIVSEALGEHMIALRLRQVGLYRPEEMRW